MNRMDYLLSIIIQTPSWIWGLFVMLLWVGYRRTKPRVSRVRILFVLPLLIFAISVKVMMGFPVSGVSLSGWAGGLVLGLVPGWLLTRNQPIRADYENGLIELPGSWATMGLVTLIFTSRYYFGYEFTVHPELKSDPLYILARLSSMGLFAGIFTGRVLGHMARYRAALPEDLSGEPRGFLFRRFALKDRTP